MCVNIVQYPLPSRLIENGNNFCLFTFCDNNYLFDILSYLQYTVVKQVLVIFCRCDSLKLTSTATGIGTE